jgi:hypothetical protein
MRKFTLTVIKTVRLEVVIYAHDKQDAINRYPNGTLVKDQTLNWDIIDAKEAA